MMHTQRPPTAQDAQASCSPGAGDQRGAAWPARQALLKETAHD